MTVSLYVRVSVKGKRRYTPVNKKRVYPDGTVFCLRYARKWETLPTDDLNTALAARALKEAALLTKQPSAANAQAKRVGIDDAIAVYLSNTAATKKHRTLLAYTLATTEFRKSCSKQFMDELTKQDLTDFVVFQKKEQLADRTIDNRLTDLGTFLHANNVALSLHQSYTEKKVRAYSVEELRALNAASTDEELQVWQFFLSTGFREDEVAHACYTDIDFKAKTIDVREKRQFDWEPKDKAERTVPIPDSLIELLLVRKSMNESRWLIFPNKDGKPQGHFLRSLKERALSAGLNCGHCTGTLDGKTVSCTDAACCEHWILHRFRKTFATLHHANLVPVRTIQMWLGHSDLETTLRYLADAELGSQKTRSQVNGSFAEIDRD
jgi:integrase/recombinase XerD